MEISMEIC
ncbi:hypothetical protein LINPERPRIM_LOCUS19253 [Linum perenne]